MLEPAKSKTVERSCRWFRRFLILYPKAHREEYGEAILQLFRDQCRDAWRATRLRGVIVFWLRAIIDLLKTSTIEHVANIFRGKSMLSLFRPTFKPLPAFFRISALVFLPVFLASVIITYLKPDIYASTTRFLISHVAAKSPSDYDPHFAETQADIIKSHAVLTKVVEKLNLVNTWKEKYGRLEASQAEAILRKNLEIEDVRNTQIIVIEAFSEDPDEAAKLANGVVNAYREYLSEQLILSGSLKVGASVDPVVTIFESAVPNPQPVRPNRPLDIILGALVSMLVGLLAAPVILGFATSVKENAISNPVPRRTL